MRRHLPPLDDGRRPLADIDVAALLDELIDPLPWRFAVEPDAAVPLDEDDLADLRKLGYVGN